MSCDCEDSREMVASALRAALHVVDPPPPPTPPTPPNLLQCSFCGKSQRQVKKLIAGPGVYICGECITLCNEIIEEEEEDEQALNPAHVTKSPTHDRDANRESLDF